MQSPDEPFREKGSRGGSRTAPVAWLSPFEQRLMERLEDYALRIIAVYGALPDYPASGYQVAQVLGKQLLRSGTSVGANYAEAIRTHSLADKAARQQVCIKELEEIAYWLRLRSRTS